MPTDLKISQFTDGGAVQNTDEIAAVRSGVNTKVRVGSAAAADLGNGPDDISTNSEFGSAAFSNTGEDVGQIPLLEDVGGIAGLPPVDGSQLTGVVTESINGLIEQGTNVSITGSGTESDPYIINSTSSVATSADDVTLDPISGLTATNVQDGLEEVWAVADTALQPSDADNFTNKVYSGNITSAVATIDITGIFRVNYNYRIVIENLLVSTSSANVWALFSTNGTTWIVTAYRYVGQIMVDTGATVSGLNSTSSTNMIIAAGGFNNASGNTSEMTLTLRNPMNPNSKTKLRSEFDGVADTSAAIRTGYLSNQDSTARAISALRILASTGNISQAKISIYEEAQ